MCPINVFWLNYILAYLILICAMIFFFKNPKLNLKNWDYIYCYSVHFFLSQYNNSEKFKLRRKIFIELNVGIFLYSNRKYTKVSKWQSTFQSLYFSFSWLPSHWHHMLWKSHSDQKIIVVTYRLLSGVCRKIPLKVFSFTTFVSSLSQ